MTKISESSDQSVDSFNLKHRITGAGVLIFFGALVLPWLLGPPSDAIKKVNSDVATAAQDPLHSTFEDRVLQEIQGVDSDFEEPEESVYVSKITPVDAGKTKVSTPVLVSGAERKLPVNTVESRGADNGTQLSSKEAQAAPSKTPTTVATKAANSKPIKAEETLTQPRKPDSSNTDTRASKTVVTPKLDVGWVVQVELLTDKKGAKRLVDELADKGFTPKTTIVDTNRGKKTGTRIWLGPYAQRAQAGTENDKLEAKMGKRGFIRVYP